MRIIFEFAGGPWDGKTVVGEAGEPSESGEQSEAEQYYLLTHHGRIGQRIRTASEYAINLLADEELKQREPHHFQQHFYEVTDRLEGEAEVLVRVEYVPSSSGGQSAR